jgi:serine protease Do
MRVDTAVNIDAEIESLGVYQVYTGGGTGSGFLIDERHLVTNAHVVAPYRQVAVESRDRSRILGSVRRVHPLRDLAIVELHSPLNGEVLKLAEDVGLKPKQPVHILGFPVGLPLSLTEGVISHPHQLMDEQYFVQTDAAINPGNSGGPMLDDDRHIVAVTTCKLNAAEAVGFGIPVADVRAFIDAYRAAPSAFGVHCPACEELVEQRQRFCPNCGTDLERRQDFADYFEPPDLDPLTAFVEQSLSSAQIDPVLARHGSHNWSFHSGSAPVKVWCCCSEHLNFSSPLAQTGKKQLDELFRYLLDAEHAPYAFDLSGKVVRLMLVIHISDVFNDAAHPLLQERVRGFVAKADASDELLIQHYGCEPAPETQLERLNGKGHA